MSKKLKAFVDQELYKKIKSQPIPGEDSFINGLRQWYDICRYGKGNIPITDNFTCWHETYFFLEKLNDRKGFEKAILKKGYDLENLFYSIWKETVTERILFESQSKSEKLNELYSKLNEIEKEGVQVVGESILAEENIELRQNFVKLQEELNNLKQAKENGGKTMAENFQIIEWEYKTITKEPGISNEKFEETLNLIGQKGWEASGTFSTERGSGTMVFKRPKGIIEKKNPNSYSN